jgi:hypothetical protein
MAEQRILDEKQRADCPQQSREVLRLAAAKALALAEAPNADRDEPRAKLGSKRVVGMGEGPRGETSTAG